MLKILAFDYKEDKHTLYYGKDCLKKFFSSLRDYTKNISNFEKKERLPLTKEKLKLQQDRKNCCIRGKGI